MTREWLLERTELMPSGCLVWTGATLNGYGVISRKGTSLYVHRLIWELERGSIPGALTIDHVRARGCIYKGCINIDHLEVVSRSENSRRGGLYRWQRIREARPWTIRRPEAEVREEKEAKPCPTCGAEAGEQCVTISGNLASQPHLARWLEPGTYRERHVYAPYRRRQS